MALQAVSLLVLVLATSCGSGPTIEEYSKAVCKLEFTVIGISTEGSSEWEDIQKVILALESVKPPTRLINAHSATIDQWETEAEFAKEQPLEMLPSTPPVGDWGPLYTTWGEFQDHTQKVADAAEALNPPPELQEFHRAYVTLWNSLTDLVQQEPQQAVITERQFLLFVAESYRLKAPWYKTVGNLSDHAFSTLVAANCFPRSPQAARGS